jgi:hypothetical protein
MKAYAISHWSHNPIDEDHWASCLRENLTSSSYGEGLETGRTLIQAPRQSFTRQRDYHELKQEIGLGHFEGRGWTGFHHHASLCIAAYAFLVCSRLAFSPSGLARILFKVPAVPEGFRPRGSAAQRTARSVVHRDHPTPSHRCTIGPPIPLSLLSAREQGIDYNKWHVMT